MTRFDEVTGPYDDANFEQCVICGKEVAVTADSIKDECMCEDCKTYEPCAICGAPVNVSGCGDAMEACNNPDEVVACKTCNAKLNA